MSGGFISKLAAFSQQAKSLGLVHATRRAYLQNASLRYYYSRKVLARRFLESGLWKVDGGLSTHMLICSKDLLMGACSAASLIKNFGSGISLMFHDDGSLSEPEVHWLESIFPGAKVIRKLESDARFRMLTDEYPYLQEVRRQCVMLYKFFDPMLFGSGERRLLVDSDVLFFRRPNEFEDINKSRERISYFNRDVGSNYCISNEAARDLIGRNIVPELNAGLALVSPAYFSLPEAEHLLLKCDFIRQPWLIEQTLHAMLASKYGVEYLPKQYELNFKTRPSSWAISKHYVGRISEYFFITGLPRQF